MAVPKKPGPKAIHAVVELQDTLVRFGSVARSSAGNLGVGWSVHAVPFRRSIRSLVPCEPFGSMTGSDPTAKHIPRAEQETALSDPFVPLALRAEMRVEGVWTTWAVPTPPGAAMINRATAADVTAVAFLSRNCPDPTRIPPF
jgi:hypothetical protein